MKLSQMIQMLHNHFNHYGDCEVQYSDGADDFDIDTAVNFFDKKDNSHKLCLMDYDYFKALELTECLEQGDRLPYNKK